MKEKLAIKNFDFVLAGAVFALVFIGVLMIANATGKPTISVQDSNWLQLIADINKKYLGITIIALLLGLGAAGLAVWVDYRYFGDFSSVIYWANIAMLLLLFILGKEINGSLNWIKIGNLSLQPAELAKLALVIALAKRLSLFESSIKTFRDLFKILFYMGVPLALILLQKDLGTAMVYVFITIVMLFMSGTKLRLLLTLAGAGLASLVPIWFSLDDFQKDRIWAFIDPNTVSLDASRHVTASKIAIGSGQVTGLGFFNPSASTQLDYIPEQQTDFIFAVLGETWGLIGTLLVVTLYAVVIFRMLWLSRQAADPFGSYLISGMMAMMMFHIFENIGMVIGVMPVTGIPLPFISYGGNAMVTNLVAIGIVLSVGLRRKNGLFRSADIERVDIRVRDKADSWMR